MAEGADGRINLAAPGRNGAVVGTVYQTGEPNRANLKICFSDPGNGYLRVQSLQSRRFSLCRSNCLGSKARSIGIRGENFRVHDRQRRRWPASPSSSRQIGSCPPQPPRRDDLGHRPSSSSSLPRPRGKRPQDMPSTKDVADFWAGLEKRD